VWLSAGGYTFAPVAAHGTGWSLAWAKETGNSSADKEKSKNNDEENKNFLIHGSLYTIYTF